MDTRETVELQLRPSCVDCMKWSQDGDLAIAAGEYVHILTSTQKNKKSPSEGPGLREWNHAKLQVNLFTTKEWPVLEAADLQELSIGEEQSLSTVCALAWSPPGLGKHHRPLLAILTTNLVLSLWETNGQLGHWERIAIVNRSMPGYPISSSRRGTRIRNFSWSPPCRLSLKENQNSESQGRLDSKWGKTFIAVSNDKDDLIVFQVMCRSDTGASLSSLEVSCTFSLASELTSPCYASVSPLHTAINRTSAHVSQLSWGPWEAGTASHSSLIALVVGYRLKCLRVSLPDGLDCSQIQLSEQGGFYNLPEWPTIPLLGPFVWRHEDGHECIILAGGSCGQIVFINFHRHAYVQLEGSDKSNDVKMFNFIYNADEMDAFRYTALHAPLSLLHQELLLLCWNEPERSLSPPTHYHDLGPPLDGTDILFVCAGSSGSWTLRVSHPTSSKVVEELDVLPWTAQTTEIGRRFDVKCDLNGKYFSKVRGLTSYSNMASLCLTLAPSDRPVYLNAGLERAYLVFGKAAELEGIRKSPKHRRAELVRQEITEWALQFASQRTFVRGFDKKLVYAMLACALTSSWRPLYRKLFKAILERLDVDLSAELYLYERDSSLPENEPRELFSLPARPKFELQKPQNREVFECCSFCGEGVKWESPDWAHCSNHHEFVRCALTFLTIQAPGISKFCSQCTRQFLSEEHGELRHLRDSYRTMPGSGTKDTAMQGMAETGQNSRDSLTYQLFDVFDVCPYCQGKFRD